VLARTIRAADVTTAAGVIKYQVVDRAAAYLLAENAGVTRLEIAHHAGIESGVKLMAVDGLHHPPLRFPGCLVNVYVMNPN